MTASLPIQLRVGIGYEWSPLGQLYTKISSPPPSAPSRSIPLGTPKSKTDTSVANFFSSVGFGGGWVGVESLLLTPSLRQALKISLSGLDFRMSLQQDLLQDLQVRLVPAVVAEEYVVGEGHLGISPVMGRTYSCCSSIQITLLLGLRGDCFALRARNDMYRKHTGELISVQVQMHIRRTISHGGTLNNHRAPCSSLPIRKTLRVFYIPGQVLVSCYPACTKRKPCFQKKPLGSQLKGQVTSVANHPERTTWRNDITDRFHVAVTLPA